MKQILFATALVITGITAHASTLSVEFWPCSGNQNYICAKVYQAGAPVEMPIDASPEVAGEIAARMTVAGHSLATSVEGNVLQVNRLMGGQYLKLEVSSLDTDYSAPRPR